MGLPHEVQTGSRSTFNINNYNEIIIYKHESYGLDSKFPYGKFFNYTKETMLTDKVAVCSSYIERPLYNMNFVRLRLNNYTRVQRQIYPTISKPTI